MRHLRGGHLLEWHGDVCNLIVCRGQGALLSREGGTMMTAMTMMQVQPLSTVQRDPGSAPHAPGGCEPSTTPHRHHENQIRRAAISEIPPPIIRRNRTTTVPSIPPAGVVRPRRRQRPRPEKERTDRSAAMSSFEAPWAKKGTTSDQGSAFIVTET